MITFAEKLDFLMTLTSTRNSSLARVLSFDSSYISRLRAGKRGIPKHQPFVVPASEYFARNVHTEYQRQALSNVITPGHEWPEDPIEAQRLIAAWLFGNTGNQSSTISSLLSEISSLGAELSRERFRMVQGSPLAVRSDGNPGLQSGTTSAQDKMFYYGNQGKREAVRAFLSELCAMDGPQTLYLYSDEEFVWLYEDPAFAREWMSLLIQLISKGGRIQIIHNIGRDLNEILEALQKWMPLYATGAIEPYYCPKVLDGILRNTMFVAPQSMALVSASVREDTEGMLNILIRDPLAVSAVELQYSNFLSLCRPLMHIGRIRTSRQLLHALDQLEPARCGDRTLDDWITYLKDSADYRMLSSGEGVNPFLLIVQERSGALFLAGASGMSFLIRNNNLLESIWDYLADDSRGGKKNQAVDALTALSSSLET